MSSEKIKVIRSFLFPAILTLVIWVVKFIESIWHLDFAVYGIYPLTVSGLRGIVLSPLIHENYAHLAANTLPLLFLSAGLFYFYQEIAWKVFFQVYFLTGIWVWFLARDAYHIGASGVIYGLASFLFLSGIIRKEGRLMALSLLVVFLYGGMIWGIFPKFFPDRNISWESHLMGGLAGIVMAVYYRNFGPQRKKYEWEEEEEFEAETGIEEWRVDEPAEDPPKKQNDDPLNINYIYKKSKDNSNQAEP